MLTSPPFASATFTPVFLTKFAQSRLLLKPFISRYDMNRLICFRDPSNLENPRDDQYFQTLQSPTLDLVFQPLLRFDYGDLPQQQRILSTLLPPEQFDASGQNCSTEFPYSGLVFTSSTGIHSIHNIVTNQELDSQPLRSKFAILQQSLPVFAVGEGTARTALKFGYSTVIVPPHDFLARNNIPSPHTQTTSPHIVTPSSPSSPSSLSPAPPTNTPTQQHAVQLGHYLASLFQHCPLYHSNTSDNPPQPPQLALTKPLLILSSQIRQPTLTTILTEWKIPYTELICYDTVPNPCLWTQFCEYNIFPSHHRPLTYQHQFGVIFSPSGLSSLMCHLKIIYAYILSQLQQPPAHTSQDHPSTNTPQPFNPKIDVPPRITPLVMVQTLQCFTTTQFIAIGATTRKAFVLAQTELEQFQHTLSQFTQTPLPCTNSAHTHSITCPLHEQLLALFFRLNFSTIPCCAEPSPQGVLDVIQPLISPP